MDFFDDEEKMRDFYILSKDEFLKSYSYLDEEDYLETQKSINRKMEEIINFTKIRLIKCDDMMVINIPFYKNGNFNNKVSTLNNFLYLAKKYNIRISKKERTFIIERHGRYLSSKDKRFSNFRNRDGEEIDFKKHLIKMKKAAKEELKNNFLTGQKRFDSVIAEDKIPA